MFLPKDVEFIIDTLYKKGYEAFVVGGCVRDDILGKKPNDYDITTSAKPNKVKEIFQSLKLKVIETGIQHGTITLVLNNINYEITTYRIEGDYLDNRRPSKVFFTENLKEDLKRRDFTINAMAYNNYVGLVDFFHGREDLNKGIIRSIGNANDRFDEDGLRMLRAIRFSTQLNFKIEEKTKDAILSRSSLIKNISIERIIEELKKILISAIPSKGINELVNLKLMEYIIPEIINLVGFNQQSKYHDKDIYYHTMEVLDNVENNISLRLAALLHDIGKPNTFTLDEKGGHFYFHEAEGAKICKSILERLKFDNKIKETVVILVKNHMRVIKGNNKYKIKKYINEVGQENLNLIFSLMIADRLASHKDYRGYDDILNMKSMCNKIITSNEPLKVKDLQITGDDIIQCGIKPGKEIGNILNNLLEKVLKDPSLNEKNILINEILVYTNNNK
nr:CCA tRNA nucleotidyltransferase [Clostridium sp. ATCC 25772]